MKIFLNFAIEMLTHSFESAVQTSMELSLQGSWICISKGLWLRKDVYERYLLVLKLRNFD